MAIDGFHIVQFRLRHVYACHVLDCAEGLNIMISASAKMRGASMEMGEQGRVIGYGEFLIELGGEIYGAVTAQQNMTAVTAMADAIGMRLTNCPISTIMNATAKSTISQEA